MYIEKTNTSPSGADTLRVKECKIRARDRINTNSAAGKEWI